MEDTGLPAQEIPSSAALLQEETAGCRIHETAAFVAWDLEESAGLRNLDPASFEDLEVAAAFHDQGKTLLEAAGGWASVDFLDLNAVTFELDLSLGENLGLQSRGSVEEHQGGLVGFPGWRTVEIHLKQLVGVAHWKDEKIEGMVLQVLTE